MAFIKQSKNQEKAQVKIMISKNIADDFNQQLEIYQQNNQNNQVLDFDPLFKKLIKELNKINNEVKE